MSSHSHSAALDSPLQSHFARYASDAGSNGKEGGTGKVAHGRYYKEEGKKEEEGDGAVRWLAGMGVVRSVATVKPPRFFNSKPGVFRFAVETDSNVFIFASETEEERVAWLASLGSLMSVRGR